MFYLFTPYHNYSVAECRIVVIGIVPLCRVNGYPCVQAYRDNDCTQWCDLDSDSPALSHRIEFKSEATHKTSKITTDRVCDTDP